LGQAVNPVEQTDLFPKFLPKRLRGPTKAVIEGKLKLWQVWMEAVRVAQLEAHGNVKRS
jgi:hypothetical protein